MENFAELAHLRDLLDNLVGRIREEALKQSVPLDNDREKIISCIEDLIVQYDHGKLSKPDHRNDKVYEELVKNTYVVLCPNCFHTVSTEDLAGFDTYENKLTAPVECMRCYAIFQVGLPVKPISAIELFRTFRNAKDELEHKPEGPEPPSPVQLGGFETFELAANVMEKEIEMYEMRRKVTSDWLNIFQEYYDILLKSYAQWIPEDHLSGRTN